MWCSDQAGTENSPGLDCFTFHVGEHRTIRGLWEKQGIPCISKYPQCNSPRKRNAFCLRHVGNARHVGDGAVFPVFMEPPTMLLVPICRDMQLWWDKPPIPSPRNRMPGDTCFDDVGRNCACVTWTQMYVTLQTKNVFHSKAVIILFFNPPLCKKNSVTHFNIDEIL